MVYHLKRWSQRLLWGSLWLIGVGFLLTYSLRGWLTSLLFMWVEWWTAGFTDPSRLAFQLFLVMNGCCLQFIRLVNNFMPWFLLAFIPALLVACWGRRKCLTVVLSSCIGLILFNIGPAYIPHSPPVLANGALLKVMSYNVWRNTSPNDLDNIAAIIRQEQPDILLLQELDPDKAVSLRDRLNGLYPTGKLHFLFEEQLITSQTTTADLTTTNQFTLQAIVSRYPLQPVEVTYKNGRIQKALVSTPQGEVAVWNVHPSHPLNWWLWHHQYRQLLTISRDVAAIDIPLIVGGDFNATSQSDVYQLVSRHLKEAQQEVGWGLGFTFPAPAKQMRFQGLSISRPVLRIDHIFYSHHLVAHRAYTLSDSGGSDHLPIVALFSFSPKPLVQWRK